MKLSRIILLTTVLFTLTVFSGKVFSMEADISLSVVENNQWINIQGISDKEFENVAIQIIKPGAVLLPGMTAGDYQNCILAMTTVTSGADSVFSKSIRVPADAVEGTYTFKFKSGDGDSKVIPYEILSLEGTLEKFQVICTSKNITNIASALNTHANALGLKLAEYNTLDEGGKTSALEMFVKNREDSGKTEFSVDEIEELIKEASIIEFIKESDENSVASVISQYESVLQLKESEIYKAFDDTLKADGFTALCKRILMQKAEISSITEIKEASDLQVLLYLVEKGGSWYTVRNVINTYYDVLGLSESDLNLSGKVKNPDLVYQELYGKVCYTKQELKNKYNAAIKTVKDKEGNGSNVGGGGSSSGGSVRLPVTQPLPVDNTQNQQPSDEFTFDDVKREAIWADKAVKTLCIKGIVSGKDKGVFAPNEYVTREEFAKLIVLMAEQQPQDDTNTDFADVNANEWYAKYIASAQKNGFINGISENNYGVGLRITRQDMAVMIYRAMGQQKSESGLAPNFADNGLVADYALQAVAYMEENGIIKGREQNNFAPQENATRAEAAQMIYNALVFLNKAN